MKEIEVRESGEIRVEGDDAGSCRRGEGGDPGVGPAVRWKPRDAAPEFKALFGGEGIFGETDLEQNREGAVSILRLGEGERRSVHHARVGEQAEQAHHGHAAKDDFCVAVSVLS